ncbi:MAG TPA: alpha/beta hydrolase fold domain-containing protein [Planctomycetota bacterium]|nr:alpha/beta hydrolase fold domain-containing protein [Planctomycetota bacterium]
MSRSILLLALAACAFAPPAAGQLTTTVGPLPGGKNPRDRIDIVDHLARLERIALTGDLGFPPLPPVYWDSPQDDLLYADRFPFGSEQASGPGDGGTPEPLDGYIPSGAEGTGTTVAEIFEYLLPAGYEVYQPELDPIPLVMAYHGYGASANSVGFLSTIEEECYERGWAYFAPTGMDDQLFGSPLCQQNMTAALDWMLENFNIDPDRIYAVGFSMGGGVMTNFASRHRDPGGTMIAALGIVSGTFDWTMSWKLGSSTVKALLESPFNFGGPANSTTFRFNYQKASGLFYAYGSYPPLGPTVLPTSNSSLATNLGTIPTYIVWDTGDTLAEVVQQEPHFRDMLESLGGVVEYHTVTGTLHPISGIPAPHSWAVLDEDALFDFFEGKVADRTPATFHALIAESGDTSWLSLEQAVTNAFSLVDGDTDPEIPYVKVNNVFNAESVHVDMQTLGYSAGENVRVNATAMIGDFDLELSGFADPPAYLIDAVTGDLVTGTLSDPLAGQIAQNVSLAPGIDALVVTDATWTTDLTTSPDPVAVGGALTLDVDAPPTSTAALLFIGFSETLGTIPGGFHITISLGPPTTFVMLPLDLDGNVSLTDSIPDNAYLAGLTLRLQAVGIGAGGVDSISNLWSLHVE